MSRDIREWDVIYKTPPGMHIGDAVAAMMELARETNDFVSIQFNNAVITADPELDSVDTLLMQYQNKRKQP